ncbi:MAG: DUF6443 domain-containing protein, partial [Bacteroidota bacterium]
MIRAMKTRGGILQTFVLRTAMMFCFLGLTLAAHAQAINNEVGDVVMPAPNAASLGKYGDIPVGYYTGVPSVGVPIHTVQEGPLSLDISLSYHASGLKVGEMASWVGQGWSLNAGGSISRTVQGLRDEGPGGYYYFGHEIPDHQQDYCGFYDYLRQVNDNVRDNEPDIFSFNIGGYSGKFYLDNQVSLSAEERVVLIPQQDLKVVPIFKGAPNDAVHLCGFEIVAPDGTIYQFGDATGTDGINKGIEMTTNSFQSPVAPSSWHLTKILSFDDRHTIYFNYEGESYAYPFLASEYNTCGGQHDITNTGNNNVDFGHSWMNGWRLKEISTSKEFIEFIAGGDRQDLEENFHFNNNQPRAKELDKIVVTSGAFCQEFVLNTDYFIDDTEHAITATSTGISANKRLRLLSVQEKPCEGSDGSTAAKPPYVFEYYGNGNFLPNRLSWAIDHWGFYNGVDDNNNHKGNRLNIPKTLGYFYTPNLQATQYIEYDGRSDRSTHEEPMKWGTLSKITYPTGGFTTFEYEANEYYGDFVETEMILNHTTACNIPTTSYSTTFQFGSQNEIDGATYIAVLEDTDVTCVDHQGCDPTSASGYQNMLVTLYENPFTTVPLQTVSLPPNPMEGNLVDLFTALEVGVTYRIAVTPCYARANFKILSNVQTQGNIKVGGLRIKKITSDNAIVENGPPIVKTYEYLNANGDNRSSGNLYQKPKYWRDWWIETDTSVVNTTSCPYYTNLIYIPDDDNYLSMRGGGVFFMNNSIVPLSGFEGAHINYSHVTEHLNGLGKNTYTYFKEDAIEYEGYPFAPRLARIQQGNQSNSEKRLVSGVPVAYDSNTPYPDEYVYSDAHLFKAQWVSTGCGLTPGFLNFYEIRTRPYRLAATSSTIDGITTTTSYEYAEHGLHLMPIATEMENSDGKVHRTETLYAPDLTVNDTDLIGMQNDLESRYMIALPLQVKKYVAGNLVGGQKSIYANLSGAPRLKKLVEIYLDGSERDMATLSYNTEGYLSQLDRLNGPTENYTWENDLVKTKSIIDREWEYHYYPGTRLFSTIVDMDGLATSYEYDEFRRLTRMAARGGGLVSTFAYNYTLAGGGGPNAIRTKTGVDDVVRYQYFDGLGRPLQTVAQAYSPEGFDVVQGAVEYDVFGRVAKAYHPLLTDGQISGAYTKPQMLTGEAYDQVFYESNPLSRETGRAFYHVGAVATTYGNGGSDPVLNIATGQSYDASQLFRVIQEDENGHPTTTYTDKIGQLVLTRRYENGNIDTYNGYDDRGNLTDVRSPMSTANEDVFSYHYEYDQYNRLRKKVLPNEITTDFSYYPNDQLQEEIGPNRHLTFSYNVYFQPEATYVGPGGTQSGQEIIRHSYYNHGGPGTGQVATTQLRVLDVGNNYQPLLTTYEYDNVSRLDMEKRETHLGFLQYVDYQYEGKTDRLLLTGYAQDGVLAVEKFDYDHGKRLINTYQNVNNNVDWVSHNRYNYRDELIEKNLGNVGEDRFLQSVDYSYNPRGWLTHVNTLRSGTTDGWPLNACEVIDVGGSCEAAPQINLTDLMTIRLTNDDLKINCYDPCADTIAVCDYTVPFVPRFNKEINEIIGGGLILNLPGPPYIWDPSGNNPYPGLTQHIEDWLDGNGYFYDEVQLVITERFSDASLIIRQTNFEFERMNGSDENGIAPVQSIFNTSNCGQLIIASEDLELQELRAAMSQTGTSNIDYPSTLYQVQLENGEKLLLTASELGVFRGAYSMEQCLPLTNANQIIQLLSG